MSYYEFTEQHSMPAHRFEHLEEVIGKLNKTAKKLGAAETTYKIVDKFLKEKDGKDVPYITVEVSGEAPKLNGWSFLGTLTPYTETENLVKSITDIQIPAKYKTEIGLCEHCDSKRNRKFTYVVHNSETNEFKSVGKNCLKDFLGHKNPHILAHYSEMLLEMSGDWDYEERGVGGINYKWEELKPILEASVMMIREFGFVSNSKVYNNPYEGYVATSTRVDNMLNNRDFFKNMDEEERARYRITGEDREEVAKIIEWGKNLDNPDTEYLQSINLICKAGYITPREYGLTVSIPTAYFFAHKKAEEEKAKAEAPVSDYVGEVNDKIETVVTVKGIYASESFYGTSYIHNMRDENGNILTWFCSGNVTMEANKTYKIKGTVKNHQMYRNDKQTILTRVKMLEEVK